jgi:hypothetical protein
MPDLTRGHTFTSGEEVDHNKLNNLTGNATINDSSITEAKIAANAVTNVKLSATAAIALSKLESGADAQVIVGSSVGVPTYVALSGDVTVSNAGVTTLGADKVLTANVLDDAVTAAKLADTDVTAGAYTSPDITVDAQGRLTAAASSVTATGSVLQMVYAEETDDTFSTQSSTMTNITGLSASITPTSASSTILIQVMITHGSRNDNMVGFGLKRGTTQIGQSTTATGVQKDSITGHAPRDQNRMETSFMQYRDSPATTSATTYQATVTSRAGGYYWHLNRTFDDGDYDYEYHGISNIVLTEISA